MMAATTTETAFQMMVSGSRGPRGTLEWKADLDLRIGQSQVC